MGQVSVRYIVDDVDAAVAFYTGSLGFEVQMRPAPGFAALARGGLRLLLNAPGAGGAGRAGGTPSPGGWNRVQIPVDRLDEVVAELTARGARLRGEAVAGAGGRQALVEDPAGNVVELFEPARRDGGDAARPPDGGAEGSQPAHHEPLHHQVRLELPPDAAFELFTAGLGDWWPLAYTFAESRCAGAVVEPHAGGRWLERTEDGEELPWGDVRAWEPPRRIVLGFGIGADRRPTPPEQASELEVRFEPAGGGTEVTLEHRDFDRHGASAETLRAGMGSPQGWPLILAELRRAARRRSGVRG